jgi:hypothetical protein
MYEVRTIVNGRPGRSIRAEYGAMRNMPGAIQLSWKQDKDVVEVAMSKDDAKRLMLRMSGLLGVNGSVLREMLGWGKEAAA